MIRRYLQGGIVPLINSTYPMARLTHSTYAAPLNYNQPSEVVGGYDAQVNPMTGEEVPQTNFADGGPVEYGEGNAPPAAFYNLPMDRTRVGFDPNERYLRENVMQGGIGPYMDTLNQQFAAGPRYGTRTGGGGGIPWVNPGDAPIYGGAGGVGGVGGAGGEDTGGGIGPGALVAAGGIYKNWDKIVDAYNKLTGAYVDPLTKLKKDEAAEATQKTEDAFNLEKNAAEANAGYVVNPLTGLFEGPNVRGGELVLDTEGVSQPTQPTLDTDAAIANAGYFVNPLTGLFEGPNVRGGELVLDTEGVSQPTQPTQPTQPVQPESATDFSGLTAAGTNAAASGVAGLLGGSTPDLSRVLVEDLAGNALTGTSAGAGAGAAGAADLANVYTNALEGLGNFGGLTNAESADLALRASLEGPELGYASRAGAGASGAGKVATTGSGLADAGISALGSMAISNLFAKTPQAKLGASLGSLAAGLPGLLGGTSLGALGGPAGALIGSLIGDIVADQRPTPMKNPLTGEMVDSGPMYDVLKDFYARPGEVLGVAQKPMSVEETLKLMQDAESGNITNANADQYFGIGAKGMDYSQLIDAYLKNGGDPRAIGSQFQSYMPGNATQDLSPGTNNSTMEDGSPNPWNDPDYRMTHFWSPERSPPPELDEDSRYAAGGLASLPEYAAGGKLLRGPGDGMSDSIKANISGKQEARLADGEFVIPADVVSHLGNGSTEAGSKRLYEMMDKVRQARTGNKKQGKQINPHKFLPV